LFRGPGGVVKLRARLLRVETEQREAREREQGDSPDNVDESFRAQYPARMSGKQQCPDRERMAQTVGRFQAADHGTLFLDEIGDLPLELQPKLLRVLQEKEFERLGSGRTVQVDVRVIAATNQGLWSMVEEGKFRADLYYRLNVFPIALPPLRERQGDIPLLIEHFVQQCAERLGKPIEHIPDEAIEVLKRRDWPGNIRELQNVIERAVILTKGRVLEVQAAVLMTQNGGAAAVRTLAEAKRAHIRATLDETNWIIGGRRGAALRLGLPRTTLMAMMERLGICREPFGQAAGGQAAGGQAAGGQAAGPQDRLFESGPRSAWHGAQGGQQDRVYNEAHPV
jgi:transcriptional regulator of aromatic amino acid metabolism